MILISPDRHTHRNYKRAKEPATCIFSSYLPSLNSFSRPESSGFEVFLREMKYKSWIFDFWKQKHGFGKTSKLFPNWCDLLCRARAGTLGLNAQFWRFEGETGRKRKICRCRVGWGGLGHFPVLFSHVKWGPISGALVRWKNLMPVKGVMLKSLHEWLSNYN